MGHVFVTVGTTSFDRLIRVADSSEFKEALELRGYSRLQLQLGRGSYTPEPNPEQGRIQVSFFRFAPNLSEHIDSASLVVSHAGSGSIFETLRAGKKLVVVINEDLMDNHQCELAEELAKNNFLFCTTPSTLVKTIQEMDLDSLVPYPRSSPAIVVRALDEFLSITD